MMKALEKWAADEFRSTNGQIEWIVQEALKKAGRLPKPDQNSGDGEVPPEQAPSS